MNANQADPSQSLRMLMASSDARVTGSERIRGVQTTHYAFNIDFKKLAHDNKAAQAADRERRARSRRLPRPGSTPRARVRRLAVDDVAWALPARHADDDDR